jgi:hypothetical protein
LLQSDTQTTSAPLGVEDTVQWSVTDINMPQLKQPRRLQEACIRLQINTCRDKCREWLQDLSEAMNRDEAAWKDVFGTVMEGCRQMEEEISKLPPGILK